eukprot:768035-Hanusia_phi.AAC.1
MTSAWTGARKRSILSSPSFLKYRLQQAWQVDSLGQDLIFVVPSFEGSSIEAELRQSSESVLAASQDAAAAYTAGLEKPLKMDRLLADLIAAAEDERGEQEPGQGQRSH